MTHLLTALLSGVACWCWGHATARVRIVVIGATPEQDDAAFIAEERARFDQLMADLDVTPPDDPRSSTA